jgi:hypothetical protein
MKMPVKINLAKQRPVSTTASSQRAAMLRLASTLKIFTFLASVGLLASACNDAREFTVTGEGESSWSKAAEQLAKGDTSANGCAIDAPTKAQLTVLEAAIRAANTADKNSAPASPSDALSWDWGSGEVILHGGACSLLGVGGDASPVAPPEFSVAPGTVKIGETINVTVTGPDNFSFENPEVDTLGCKGLTVSKVTPNGKTLTFDISAVRGRCGAQPGDVKIAITTGPEKGRDTHLVDFTIEAGNRIRTTTKGVRTSERPCTRAEEMEGIIKGTPVPPYKCKKPAGGRAVFYR